tara:strand:+ start:508 stop:816 length:309 start_codon:yes stop_codon:yes gene_type:complete
MKKFIPITKPFITPKDVSTVKNAAKFGWGLNKDNYINKFQNELKLTFWNSFTIGIAPIILDVFTIALVQIFLLGLIGEYMAIILTHSRKLPLVIEEERFNFD